MVLVISIFQILYKMINPAFIVDGFTEKLIIEKICPGKTIKRADINGKNVTLDAIAKKIASLIRLLNNRYHPIIILIDKEERNESISDIINSLHSKIVENGITSCDIRIGVADRMIENWIIADWACISSKMSTKPIVTEGINGTSVIKKNKINYNKTTDGVNLFLLANQKIIYKNSESYRCFIDKLNDLKCEYLKFERE